MKQFDRADAERLVQTYSDLILRLAYTYLKSTHDAEDICQNIFLKLLTGGQTFDSPAHEKHGSSARPPTPARTACAPRTGAMSVWKPLPRHPAPAAPDSDVLDAVMALPRKYREAVYLHYYEGLFRARNRVSARSERVCRFRTPEPRAQKPAHHLGRIFMNREYNDNKMYNSALDELRFSKKRKAAWSIA